MAANFDLIQIHCLVLVKMMEAAMKLLKSIFIQRFSAMDVLVLSAIMTSDLSLWVVLLAIAAWSGISVFVERVLDIRRLNGNSPWCEL